MSPKTAIFALVAMVLCVTKSEAQTDRAVVNQAIEWFSATSMIKVQKRSSVLVDGNFRFARALEPMQFQLRTGVDFEINKHLSVMPLGYVYTWNPLYGKQPNQYVNNEHRIFQQLVYKHRMGRASVSHRARLEQRFTEKHDVVNGDVVNEGYSVYTNRIRYRFNASIPLNKPQIEPGAFYAVVYDEIFVSFGDQVTYHQPDQNRVFAGVGYTFNKKFSLQGGPFYQILIKAGGTKQENNIGLSVNLNYNFDLTTE